MLEARKATPDELLKGKDYIEASIVFSRRQVVCVYTIHESFLFMKLSHGLREKWWIINVRIVINLQIYSNGDATELHWENYHSVLAATGDNIFNIFLNVKSCVKKKLGKDQQSRCWWIMIYVKNFKVSFNNIS